MSVIRCHDCGRIDANHPAENSEITGHEKCEVCEDRYWESQSEASAKRPILVGPSSIAD